MSDTTIRILEKDNNRRGDLFGRLMADLFVALGYEQPRLNIHKSGRELDLSAEHRLESRRAIAECKATSSPIGGDDVNKFIGALDAERKRNVPTIGYFISLAGFKETAIEQERQGRRTKIITLTGLQVVSELVKGRILIPRERATELAGRCCEAPNDLTLDLYTELLAHERGWIWAIYYTHGTARSHFALIHSDGTPLARAVAEDVIAADRGCGGRLHALICLNPAPQHSGHAQPQLGDALTAYRQYLANECGHIHLDGLPADNDVGSRRLRLENLFVPLHLDVAITVNGETKVAERLEVGSVLAGNARLALLAAPGGGKSTLIKRLAVAYSDPARRSQIADDLPRRDWLPLFFRCRELRGLARASFADLLDALSQRELVRQYTNVFRTHIDHELLAGRVLLLVDGLDEISDPGDRAAFVSTLRAALQAYPQLAMVVTSREAGFRHVAAHLAPVCTHATLSSFDADDIRRLSVAWHREVVGDTEKVRFDAEQLATTIAQNDRINRLAVNPLLLTTLLLVKRWVGALPTRRAVLYGEAVKVLLRTWNTEGHDPIPEEEALPQLCYIASAMMLQGIQKISRPRLADLLQEARDALPTELGYVRGTVDEFIHRVEDRSSLLMMTGHDVEDGRLVEFFEFRHLTFQEYLTALAMVEGWHPGRIDDDTLVSVLKPHFEEVQWREVIPLAAVLGGKATEALIRQLTERVSALDPNQLHGDHPAFFALGNCLADEASARPETIRAAVRQVVRHGSVLFPAPFTSSLARGKYGADFRDEAGNAFLSAGEEYGSAGDALLWAVWYQTIQSEDTAGYPAAAATFVEMSKSPDIRTRCEGAVGVGRLCHYLLEDSFDVERAACQQSLRHVGPLLAAMLDGTRVEHCAACYALAPLSACRYWIPPAASLVHLKLFSSWVTSNDKMIQRLAAIALASQPLLAREDGEWHEAAPSVKVKDVLERYEDQEHDDERPAILIVAWHQRTMSDDALAERIKELLNGHSPRSTRRTLQELLKKLGGSVEEHVSRSDQR